MILVIDSGNSRMKWGLHGPRGWVAQGAVANAELAVTLGTYGAHGFAPFAAEWQRRHAYQGKAVKLLLPDGVSVKGTVAGVDGTGALVLADGPRRVRFLAGEISLRRA